MGLLYYRKYPKPHDSNNLLSWNAFIASIRACICYAGFLLLLINSAAGQEAMLEKLLTIPKQNTTLYNALNLISQKADVLFIYDSQVVENNKRVKLEARNEPLHQVLDEILTSPGISYKVIGQHILIYNKNKEVLKANKKQAEFTAKDSIRKILVRGNIYDNESKAVIPYATIGIEEENIGTISNADGFFQLKVPASFAGSSLIVSCMGYLSQGIPLELLNEQQVDIYLSPRIISIQEVIIRYIDPNTIVQKAIKQLELNYSSEPVYMTSFYREGVQKNKKYISYSEAVFKVYKSAYTRDEHSDQVKLLKSRKIQNERADDTVYVKLKAGIQTALQLDIVKCIPGFLDLNPPVNYTYTYSDLVSFNARDAYAITFVQNEDVKEALFSGTLFIDKENYAILGAEFEMNPAYLDIAAADLVLKKSRRLNVKFEKISYTVSYTKFNGKYYLNHARCDMNLKTRLRNHLSSDNFTTFLEFASCRIDTVNVTKFAKQEVLKPAMVFSEAAFDNNDSFWYDYNTIAPEEKLSEALSRIIGKIEEVK